MDAGTEDEVPLVTGTGMIVLPEVEAEKEVEVGTLNDGELAGAVWETAESVVVVADADADRILLTSEASEDEAPEMIDAEAEARAEDALEPILSELTMLDNSELIDDEMADRTLEAAEAATPLVVVGVASVVLEAVLKAPVIVPEASEDEVVGVIDPEAEASEEESLGLTVSELTTLDESELIDVEAAEAAEALVIL